LIQKLEEINQEFNKLSLFKIRPELLIDLMNYDGKKYGYNPRESRNLNYIASYIILNSDEISKRIFTLNCNLNHHFLVYQIQNYQPLEIITINYTYDQFIENNKIVTHIKKIIDNNDITHFSIQCSRKNKNSDNSHFFCIIVYKQDEQYHFYIIDSFYGSNPVNDFSIDDSDRLLSEYLLRTFSTYNISIHNSKEFYQRMPQSLTKELSCQIWSIMYQYILLCSNIKPDNSLLHEYINLNPFFIFELFLSNIFYDYLKKNTLTIPKKDIIMENNTININNITQYKYFSIFRQLRYILIIADEEEKEYQIKRLINFSLNVLLDEIFKFKSLQKYNSKDPANNPEKAHQYLQDIYNSFKLYLSQENKLKIKTYIQVLIDYFIRKAENSRSQIHKHPDFREGVTKDIERNHFNANCLRTLIID